MKIVVMGTGPFAVPTCRRMIEEGIDIALCVTRPLPAVGPKKLPERPVFEWATAQGIEVFEPWSINAADPIDRLRDVRADLFFVCDYGQILSAECLAASRLGGINLHGSLLPRHRGAAPVQWTLLQGDAEAGVSVIHMSPRLDAGPILAAAKTTVLPDETAAELEPRLAAMGPDITMQSLELLQKWDGQGPLGTPQDPRLVTRAPRLHKHHGQLDFRLPAEYLVRLVRGLQPWPGTYAELEFAGGKSMRVILRRARAVPISMEQVPADGGCGQTPSTITDTARTISGAIPPGTARMVTSHVLGADWQTPWDRVLAIQTGRGMLLASHIQPAGKRAMTAAELARGYDLSEARFRLPSPPCEPLV